MFYAGIFAPQLLQKCASGWFGVPHWMQNRPAGAGSRLWDAAGALGAEKVDGWNARLSAWGVTGWLTSWRNPSDISLAPERNSLSALPTLRPISGSRFGPKMSRATTIMITIWMGWIPNGTGNSFLLKKPRMRFYGSSQ
jgi:hypothetical protein